GEVADVDDRRGIVGRPSLAPPLEGHRGPGQPALVRGQRACEAAARALRRGRRRGEREAPRQLDPAELLREALNPAAYERDVLVHPDVGAGGDELAVDDRVDDEKELSVLAANGVIELVAVIGAPLPVDEEGRRAARVVAVRLQPGWEDGRDRIRVGPVLDDEELSRVMP